MTRFVITRGPPSDSSAAVVFDAEEYSSLVRHLLTIPYTSPRPILHGPVPQELAEDLFGALAMGGFLIPAYSPILVAMLRLSALGPLAGVAATTYLKAIDSQMGSSALPIAAEALAMAARLTP